MSSATSEVIQCTLPQAGFSPAASQHCFFTFLCLNTPFDGKLTTSQGSPLTLGQLLSLGALPNVELSEPTPFLTPAPRSHLLPPSSVTP